MVMMMRRLHPSALSGAPIPTNVRHLVTSQARGVYQRDLLGSLGWVSSVGGRWHASRAGLLRRIQVAIRRLGWAAEAALVLSGDPSRWRAALILRAPTGRLHQWGAS